MLKLTRIPVGNALIVLVILVSISLLSYKVFFRLDFTENKEYTLSQATKNVLGRLDDVVTISVYFSKDLPSYFATLDRQVKDLMDEYEAHGSGNIQVEFIDPASDQALEASMQRMGIPKLQLTRYEKERAEVMSAYLGIAIQFAGKNEVIPVVQGVERLEYDITSALVKVSTEQQTVGIATAGSLTAPEGLAGLQQLLRAQHNVQVVNLVDGPVPPGVTALIVMDDDAFTEVEIYRIDQYIMGGGKVFFLAGGVGVNLGTLVAQNRDVKVGPLLRAYGIEIQNSLIVDAQAPMVGFDVGTFFPLSVRYPWFPQVVDKGFSRENPITSELQSLTFPWTSPLTLIGDTTSSGISVDILARSSERSFASPAPYNLNPQNRITLPEVGVGPQVLAVALVGSFTSHWKGNPQVPGDSLGVAPRPLEQSPETQIAVVGNTNFLDNRFLQQFPTNSVFAANVVDWMTAGTDLIAIRSRSAMNRPLEEIEGDSKGMLKTLAMLPVPVLVILFGLVWARLRQKRRQRYPEEFGRSAT